MQNLDSSLCTTTPTTVKDNRDNQEYIIQRLADGNCWMISNLNLAGGTKLYSDSSDVPSGYPESGGTEYYQLEASSVAGFSDDTQAYVYNSGNKTDAQSDCTSSAPCNSYYSWISTVAGNKTNVSTDGGQAPYSICPKGWRLPTATTNGVSLNSGGYTGGDFYRMALAATGQSSLANGYYENSATFYNNAGPGTTPNFLLAGDYYNNSFRSGGSYGGYWSSSSRSSTSAYYLRFNSGYVDSAYSYLRREGFSVRCILNETMQDFSSTDATAMSVGGTRTLTDSRDGQAYTIRKLPDNNVWMVQNLRYVGDTGSTSSSMIMKADTSNISTDQNLTIGDLTLGNDYNNARIHNSGNTTNGVWYNYAAASAGYVTSNKNSTVESTESVCPKNWRLPTNSEMSGITSYQSAFFNGGSPVTGGHYGSGSVNDPGYGYWWSSTPYSSGSNNRYYLYYYGSSLNTDNGYRSHGFYVRCIRSS